MTQTSVDYESMFKASDQGGFVIVWITDKILPFIHRHCEAGLLCEPWQSSGDERLSFNKQHCEFSLCK